MTSKKEELGDGSDGPIAEGWELTVADGYAGYGVYAHMTEYPEEGAMLLLPMEPGKAKTTKPVVQCVTHGECFGGECIYAARQPKQQEPSPTAGMNIAQRILHVGGRNNAAGYVEFGSIQAVEALVRQVIRDLPNTQPPAREPLTDQRVLELEGEVERLNAIVNTPQADDFLRAVSTEAEHQRQRWGSEHDAGKAPADWFWLIGYLAGKALHAHTDGKAEKAEHHIITTAAACANWHLSVFGKTNMRPGIDADPNHGIKGNS